MEFKELLENKFSNILSGVCLTSFREESKKIVNKYSEINEDNFIDLRNDFSRYLRNYFLLRDYEVLHHDHETISVSQNGKIIDFLIDYDWENDQNKIKLKILDSGSKIGISKSEIQNVILIGVVKKVFLLMNCDSLKKQIKENREVFVILTENDKLFKTQYVNFELSKLSQKYKIFNLK